MKKGERSRMPRAQAVGDILEKVLGERGMDQQLHKYRAFACWNRAVGPQIAAQTQPARIRNGILEVKVAHPVWMQQLQLLKPRILAKLAEFLGPGVIRDIYLRRGRIDPSTSTKTTSETPSWQKTPLAPEEEERITSIAARVDDPDLRTEFERVMRRQKQLEKARAAAQGDGSGTGSSS